VFSLEASWVGRIENETVPSRAKSRQNIPEDWQAGPIWELGRLVYLARTQDGTERWDGCTGL
jgi:hypothetical protein